MAKYAAKAAEITVPGTVKAGESFLNDEGTKNAFSIEAQLEGTLEKIYRVNNKMYECVSSMITKKTVTGTKYQKEFKKLASSLKTRANGTKKRLNELKAAFDDDAGDYVTNALIERINKLDEKIKDLESKVNQA